MTRREPIDPAVAAILGHQDFRRQVRSKPQSARELKRQRSRQRVTLELHPAITGILRSIAELEGCSPAAACNYLLAHAAIAYGDDEIDFTEAKAPSESNRWTWIVVLDPLLPTLERVARGLAKGALGLRANGALDET
jgi:hypothetical protein